MMNENEGIIIICFIMVLGFAMYKIRKNKLTVIEQENTGLKLMVVNDQNKQPSADLLSQIIIKMFKLRNTLLKDKNNYPDMKEYIELLGSNFNQERTKIYENDPSSELTSFSVNKGEEVALCLKSKKTGELHKENLLLYVAIHEMAHMGCPEIGHGELFKKVFKFLTLRAMEMGIYKKEDYNTSPVEYCGMILSSSIV